MQFWKKTEKNSFTEIQRMSEGLSTQSSHSASQKIVAIFNNLFQSFNQSLLSTLYEEVLKQKQQKQRKLVGIVVDLFSPKSQFGKALIANKDSKIELESLSYSGQFQNYLKQSQLVNAQIFKKQEYSYRIPLLQCFFANLALCIPFLKDHEKKVDDWQLAFHEDMFYFYIVRNPILMIIKNWLAYARTNYNFYSRIMKVLECILLKDLCVQVRKKQKATLRNSIIYAVYVISEWKVGVYHWELLESISETIQKRSNNSSLLTVWIKLNLSIIMNATPFEQKIREEIRQFSSQHSPFQRKYFQNIDQISQYSFGQIDSKIFTSFLLKVQSLIKKNFWESSPLFIQSMFLLLCISNKILEENLCPYRLSFMKNIFKKGHCGLKTKKDIEFFDRLCSKFKEIVPLSDLVDDEEDYEAEWFERQGNNRQYLNRKDDDLGDKRQKKSLLVHQGDPSSLSIWMKPLQPYESYLLFHVSKSMAFVVDKIRRKKPFQDKSKSPEEYPITNLRCLASQKLFFTLLFLLGLMYWLMIF